MGDRDRRVVLQEEERERAPNEARSAHDHGVAAGGIQVFTAEELEDSQGGGRDERGVPLGQPSGVVGMQAVDVLAGRDPLQRPVGVEVGGKRHLEQDRIQAGGLGE